MSDNHLHDLDDVAPAGNHDEQPVTVDQLLDADDTITDELPASDPAFDVIDSLIDRADGSTLRSYRRLVTALDGYDNLTFVERAIFNARIAREDRPSR